MKTPKNIKVISVESISYGSNAHITVMIDHKCYSGNKYILLFNADNKEELKIGEEILTLEEASTIINAINSVIDNPDLHICAEKPHAFSSNAANNLSPEKIAKLGAELNKLENEQYFDFSKV